MQAAHTIDTGVLEEQLTPLPLCEARMEASEHESERENPQCMILYSYFVFPTPAPFPLPLSPPTLQEDALGVGFDLAANTLRRCVNDDWHVLKALFQHLAVTTPHTSAA